MIREIERKREREGEGVGENEKKGKRRKGEIDRLKERYSEVEKERIVCVRLCVYLVNLPFVSSLLLSHACKLYIPLSSSVSSSLFVPCRHNSFRCGRISLNNLLPISFCPFLIRILWRINNHWSFTQLTPIACPHLQTFWTRGILYGFFCG